jgi:hypothetical protein
VISLRGMFENDVEISCYLVNHQQIILGDDGAMVVSGCLLVTVLVN